LPSAPPGAGRPAQLHRVLDHPDDGDDSDSEQGEGGAMTDELIPVDETLRALAEATSVGEVKTIRDKAAVMVEYAKRARNGKLVEQALDIQWQATRKLGRMLIEMAARGERQRRGGDRKSKSRDVTLIDLTAIGITKMQSYRAQVLARMPDATFRHHFDAAVHRVLSCHCHRCRPRAAPSPKGASIRGRAERRAAHR
jgi:hypothetical protein